LEKEIHFTIESRVIVLINQGAALISRIQAISHLHCKQSLLNPPPLLPPAAKTLFVKRVR
jgi:hypothetical protein